MTWLDFQGAGFRQCEACFCCCFASLSSLKQLMVIIHGQTNVSGRFGSAEEVCCVTLSSYRLYVARCYSCT